jgi:hypothetical protein
LGIAAWISYSPSNAPANSVPLEGGYTPKEDNISEDGVKHEDRELMTPMKDSYDNSRSPTEANGPMMG